MSECMPGGNAAAAAAAAAAPSLTPASGRAEGLCLLRLTSRPTVNVRCLLACEPSTSSTHPHYCARNLAAPLNKRRSEPLRLAKTLSPQHPPPSLLRCETTTMCLIKIRRDDLDDDYTPSRRVVRVQRVEERRNRIRPSSPRGSSGIIAVTTTAPQQPIRSPRGYTLPPPQPVPVFVEPPPPAPAAPATDVRYVHVSPRSSFSDRREDDYVYRKEIRREYSPARSSRGGDDFYEYRRIEEPRRSSRSRSRSRRRFEDEYDDEYDDRRERVRVSARREYRD